MGCVWVTLGTPTSLSSPPAIKQHLVPAPPSLCHRLGANTLGTPEVTLWGLSPPPHQCHPHSSVTPQSMSPSMSPPSQCHPPFSVPPISMSPPYQCVPPPKMPPHTEPGGKCSLCHLLLVTVTRQWQDKGGVRPPWGGTHTQGTPLSPPPPGH